MHVTSPAGIKREGSECGSWAVNFGVTIMVLLKEWLPPTSPILLVDLSRSSRLLKIRQVLAINSQSLPARLRVEILAQMYILKGIQNVTFESG